MSVDIPEINVECSQCDSTGNLVTEYFEMACPWCRDERYQQAIKISNDYIAAIEKESAE